MTWYLQKSIIWNQPPSTAKLLIWPYPNGSIVYGDIILSLTFFWEFDYLSQFKWKEFNSRIQNSKNTDRNIPSHNDEAVIANPLFIFVGLPWWLSGKESICQCKKHEFDPWVRNILWRRKWRHSSIFAREIPWTEAPGRLQSRGLQKSQTQLSD